MGVARPGLHQGRGTSALMGPCRVQTNGGLINEGYCDGFNNVLEVVQQLRGNAEGLLS